MPKLFVLEGGDPYNLTERMKAVYEMMTGPKEFYTFHHGACPHRSGVTRMFQTPSTDEFRQLLIDFLQSLAE